MTVERGPGRASAGHAKADAAEVVDVADVVQEGGGAAPRERAGADTATVARRTRFQAQWRYIVAALGYFTRVPIPHAIALDAHDLAGASRYFPLIGVLVGAVGALVYLVALSLFPAGVAVLLSMAATLLLTGALHEDGLADCCDGLGGGMTRDDALRIMRDPRLGAFGAIGLMLSLALKWQTLTALPTATAAWAMVGSHAASRALAVTYLATHDYAREQGKAKRVAQPMSKRSLAVALMVGLPWLLVPDWRAGVLGLAVIAALRFLLGRYFARRLGGYTGDCLGFAQQVFELALYLTVLAWTSF